MLLKNLCKAEIDMGTYVIFSQRNTNVKQGEIILYEIFRKNGSSL